MNMFIYILRVLMPSMLVFGSFAEDQDYCHLSVFEPSCDIGEVIVMKSALYGRMKLGQCVPHDFGYIGCSSDVLPMFDILCSGHSTCRVEVNDKNVIASGGCLQGLQRYLEADYECRKALDFDASCISTEIDVENDDVLLPSFRLHPCVQNNKRQFTIKVKEGQQLNISLISLTHLRDQIYGTIQDGAAGNSILFGTGRREQHILASTRNKVLVTLQGQTDESNFILRLQVSGCPDMTPPDGAWMIRDGNSMEIGCHSGAKSWSLKCEQNQWIGAVGLCGSDSDSNELVEMEPGEKNSDTISINVLMFAGSSVIILLSAIIFLVGVCILRRKLQPSYKHHLKNVHSGKGGAYGNNTLLPGVNVIDKEMNKDRALGETSNLVNAPPAYTMYANTARSDASGSVQYYVLEDNRQNNI